MLVKKIINEKMNGLLDFSESTIFFHFQRDLPTELVILSWGTIIDHELAKQLDLKWEWAEDLYIAGFTKVIFEQVVGGHIDISLYDPNNPNDFLRDRHGDIVKLNRRWEMNSNSKEICRYDLFCGCVIDWPHGYGELTLFAGNDFSIEFDTDDCIPVREYIRNADKFTYKI